MEIPDHPALLGFCDQNGVTGLPGSQADEERQVSTEAHGVRAELSHYQLVT